MTACLLGNYKDLKKLFELSADVKVLHLKQTTLPVIDTIKLSFSVTSLKSL